MTALLSVETAPLDAVTYDIYRNIHKAIRAEMFGVVTAIGSVDPSDGDAVAAVATRFDSLVDVLRFHAEHEDEFLQPLIEVHAPALAEVIEHDHPVLEEKLGRLQAITYRAVDAPRAERRALVHRTYLGYASFAAEYLLHQEFEETEIMPALSRAVSVDELIDTEQRLVASIPPDKMAQALALMLPALNIDESTELLGGIQAGAPAEAFAGVVGLARTVLTPGVFSTLALRLGVS